MNATEQETLRIVDLDPAEREDLERAVGYAQEHSAYLHIEVRRVVQPRVETQVWAPDTEKPGYLKHVRTKTVGEVYAELCEILGEFPNGGEEYFLISIRDGFTPDTEWPPGQIAVYPVTGSSEGHYIHVEVMGGYNFSPSLEHGTYAHIFTGKTFMGWGAAWAFSKRLAELLDV